MKPTDLNADYLRHLLHYDPLTGVWTWINPRSSKFRCGDIAGTIQVKGYRYIKIDGRSYIAARLAFLYMTGEWPTDEVDHINRLPDDDRWDNLRQADRTMNTLNRVKLGVSGIPGVRKHSQNNSWTASYKRAYIGTFKTMEGAVAARKDFMERHGLEPTISDTLQ